MNKIVKEAITKIQRIKCGNGNCYILSNGKNAVLIDTCREKYKEKILNACKEYHIQLVILTHGHLDHVQNAAFLSEQLHAPIAMSRADLELINDNIAQSLKAKTLLGKIVLAVSIKSLSTEKITPFIPSVYLSEGDTLEPYGISAEILSVPGHTNGSIAIDVNKKDLIVGDALMNMFSPTVSMLYHDEAVMRKSVEKISNLGNRTIHFGHGKPVANRVW
ncbi:MAG: MBL fold metallo-hydrolase [Spirochaetales bacterium]|nr:MBL fold metallo-hydrolase [Spirochaetales bacterium]